MKRETKLWVGAAIYVICALSAKRELCGSAFRTYGLEMRTCPDGRPRQTAHLEVAGVRRGAPGRVTFGVQAHYTRDDADAADTVAVTKLVAPTLALIDVHHASKPLTVEWEHSGDRLTGKLTLPDVPDGDYQLHAAYETRLGKGELDVALPLYTPARIHVISDRPLYEPGNTVKFRAVVLRARDLAPLDGRPGRWIVKDPQGDVMLEEKAPAGEWGVVAGTFPLDRAAQTGTWHLAWESADATDEIAFQVEPFTLPRFHVDTSTPKPFYVPGETPVIRGAVVYASGAPVANAKVTIDWTFGGAWPPPADWQSKLLPKQAVTGANGRFELAVPTVPKDLQGKVTMTAMIAAVDPAGDRVGGTASVLLSEDPIDATAVTELGDGLVQGFNNRMYLRVTTPDGRAVPNAKVKVVRAWQPGDKGFDGQLDEDGVAALQLDPGPPVNVVIPALPWRPQPRQQLVQRGEIEELIAGEGAPLADQVEMDRWLAGLAACGKWVGDAGASDEGSDASGGVRVGMRVDASGTVVQASAGPTPLGACVTQLVRAHHLPPGAERMYAVSFEFGTPDLPSITASVESVLAVPPSLAQRIDTLAKSARDCMPITAQGALPRLLLWHARAGSKDVELGGWAADPRSEGEAPLGCVPSRVAGHVTLETPAESDSLGIVRFTIAPPAREGAEARPQPTTMLGYELLVTTDAGSTKLRVTPGQVPDLRLRVNPVLAKPGDTITAELIRGPNFGGQLPKQLVLSCAKLAKPIEAKLDAEHHAKLVMPAIEGWCELTGGGTRALVYARPQAELEVALTANDKYKPGDKAELAIETRVGGKGGKAAVGLFGVDASLGQLVPLPGPDDMARVRPKVETGAPAFGVLDGQALALGRIRGANAAAATVLRVTSIPQPPQLDTVVTARADSAFDPVEELTDRFYTVLGELHVQARQWEAQAPANEKMHPAKLAELWRRALAACRARGERIDDAYGRELRLSRLPADLLALTDPRAVVVLGTRLPEDIENWPQWVAKEKP